VTPEAGSVARRIVVGVGHRDRGDDAIGPTVCDVLERSAGVPMPWEPPEIWVVEGDPCDLAVRWLPTDRVVLIDALHSGRPPGSIVVLDGLDPSDPSPARQSSLRSSHGLGVADAIELARHLRRLPAQLTVIAVEAARFDHGAALSDDVASVVDLVAQHARAALSATTDANLATGRHA
jgi:hydrogenase maturation protease